MARAQVGGQVQLAQQHGQVVGTVQGRQHVGGACRVRMARVRSMLAAEDGWQELLHAVQRELMVVMSHVATPSGVVNPNPLSAAELTLRCEQEMDAMTVLLTDNGYFLLPGGTPISAQLQFARTVARRAERRLWTLHRQDPVNEDILRFINRLSDLFFVMARMEMQRQDWPEEKWQEFAYKRKRQ